MHNRLNTRGDVDYLRVDSLNAAVSALAKGPRKILAGGTDVFPSLQDRPLVGAILDISGIAELGDINFDGGYWRIGAAASWRSVIDADLPPAFDALKTAAREVGSVQIQNRATIIGNLCNASPAADGVPPLLILNAEVEIAAKAGLRHLPLSAFILGNRKTALKANEMVSALRIPLESTVGKSGFLKLGARSYLVISISMAALRLDVDAAGLISTIALSVGACSEVAMRMDRAEAALLGTPLATATERVMLEHFDALAPIDDVRAPASYRRQASVEVVRRLLADQQRDFASGINA
ncbi:FAD binding domain-containing protein [Candidatus Puniceispirillum sp.]|nr:FAD binding domain-containing protein [Candidatus Puniceispirillum sp.]